MTDGIVVFYKPSGMTSQTAVNIVKRLTKASKAGHCGTLDPLAQGVLPIMLGNAVKASEFLTDHDKTYIAGIKLGLTTDSGDITGQALTEYSGALPDFETFAKTAKAFEGENTQVPPMYSALKKDGHKLVDLARKGITVERDGRQIKIYSLTPFQKDGEFYMTVSCSRGTYIRTLCEDIGNVLGCGGCMSFLERVTVGGFTKEMSATKEDLEKGNYSIIPVEDVFPYKGVTLPPFFDRLYKNGQPIYLKKIGLSAEIGEKFKLCDENGFYSVGVITEKEGEKVLKSEKFFFSSSI